MLKSFFDLFRWVNAAKGAWAVFGGLVMGWGVIEHWFETASLTERVSVGLLVAVVVATVIAAILAFLAKPPASGIYTARSLGWYALPIQRVRFDFRNYLGLSSPPLRIGAFGLAVRAGWAGGIEPRSAYIECRGTGERQDVRIECGDPYVVVTSGLHVPPGRWFRMQAHFGEPGPTPEEFLTRWNGFTFVFEHSRGTFQRVFTRDEIKTVISRFRDYSNPPPDPRVSIRRV